MENNINNNPITPQNNPNSGRILAGVIIIFFGFVLLANQLNLNIVFPKWLFKWEMILIVIGFFIGGTTGFKNQTSYILIGIGSVFLLDDVLKINFWQMLFPAGIIALGIWLIVKKNDKPKNAQPDPAVDYEQKTEYQEFNQFNQGFQQDNSQQSYSNYDGGEHINSTAVFSEIKKIITSKKFKGGEIVNVFGGTDINLMQSDLTQPVVINIFQIFAGTKIIVPSHWRVVSEVASVFGEVDDRRLIKGESIDNEKIVYLKGTSIFGGITIKSH